MPKRSAAATAAAAAAAAAGGARQLSIADIFRRAAAKKARADSTAPESAGGTAASVPASGADAAAGDAAVAPAEALAAAAGAGARCDGVAVDATAAAAAEVRVAAGATKRVAAAAPARGKRDGARADEGAAGAADAGVHAMEVGGACGAGAGSAGGVATRQDDSADRSGDGQRGEQQPWGERQEVERRPDDVPAEPAEGVVADEERRQQSAMAPVSASCGLTPYELERQARIAANKARLAALVTPALKVVQATAAKVAPKPKPQKRPSRRSTASAAVPAVPLRRSTRSRGPPPTAPTSGTDVATAAAAAAAAAAAVAAPAYEAHKFDDSAVVQYDLTADDDNDRWGGANEHSDASLLLPESGDVPMRLRLRRRGRSFADAALKRVYSCDRRGGLLVAAGKDGRASVFAIDGSSTAGDIARGESSAAADDEGDDDEGFCAEPILSWKAHPGWIGDVQWMSGGSGRLVTASNDKTVRLWDARAQSEIDGAPRELACTAALHSGGIFSLHELATKLLTTSKDGGEADPARAVVGGAMLSQRSALIAADTHDRNAWPHGARRIPSRRAERRARGFHRRDLERRQRTQRGQERAMAARAVHCCDLRLMWI